MIRLGLVGAGIGASRTPRMHEAEAAAQGLDLRYEIIDTAIEPAPLSAILDRAEREGFAGLNITHPFKREALRHVTALSPGAAAVGAINTVVFGATGRTGHNTDHAGFREAFRRGLPDVRRERVLLLGAGGAGVAVARALLDEGVGRLLVHDVDRDAAADLAGRFGAEAAAPSAAATVDGIVNATPVGMAAHPGSPIDPAVLTPRHWVADIVYLPLETALLRAARERGCRTLPGTLMAVFQAVRAFQLFTGREADADRMAATFASFDAV